MKIIGITGGVGSGKSEVLRYLEKEYQAFVCQADEVARSLQKRGQICYEEIRAYYGDVILGTDGELDRGKLAELIFHDPNERARLNAMVHPHVKERIREVAESEQQKGTSLFVLEAALLLEDHYEQMCDEVWYIYTEYAVRRRRLAAARGYTEDKMDAIFNAQLSEAEFRKRCGQVIDNSGVFEDTCRQIQRLLKDRI